MKRPPKDSASQRLYSTGDVSRLLGIPISTQKNWEAKGYLLTFEHAGCHRRYTAAGVRRLLQIESLTKRYRFQEQVLNALNKGEEADVELPTNITGEKTPAGDQAPDREELLDLLARNAQLFAEQRQLSKELASRTQLLETVMQRAREGFLLMRLDGSIVLFNRGMEAISGYKLEEIGQQGWFSWAYPDKEDRARALQQLRRGAIGELQHFETEITCRDRAKKWLAKSLSPIELDGQKLIFATVTDITESKRAEEALWDSKERFRAIFKSADTGILLVDMEGGQAETNPALADMFGYQRRELPNIVVPELQNRHVQPAEAHLFRDLLDGRIDHYELERLYRRKDGASLWAQLNVSIVPRPDGQPRFLIVIVKNITSRKAAEEKLEYRSKFESLIAVLSTSFINLAADEIDEGINRALEAIGEFAGADRSYLVQFNRNATSMDTTHEWCASGIEPALPRVQDLAVDSLPWSTAILRRLELLYVPRVADLPLEAMAERAEFEAQGIKSIILVPLAYRGSVKGFVGFDSVQQEKAWSEDDARLLRLVGEMLVNALERKRTDGELRTSEARYKAVFSAVQAGIVVVDKNGQVVDANEQAQDSCGLTLEQMRSMPPSDPKWTAVDENGSPLPGGLHPSTIAAKTGQEVQELVMCVNTGRGDPRWGIVNSTPFMDPGSGEVLGAVATFMDITRLKKMEEQIKYLSFHDKLTGLYNRTFFEEELRRLDTQRQLPLSVIMGDLNGLKLLNDAFGHEAGDRQLARIANILGSCCRKDDIIARWGGDEFVLLLPKTEAKTARSICERISNACKESMDMPIPLSIALGSATKTNPSQQIKQILKDSEDRMYQHKLLESSSARSSIIASLEKTLAERNYETEEHAQRLKDLAIQMGKSIGLSDSELDELALLTTLHDIGKIAIPDAIIIKQGPLTPEEWQTMKKHAEIGYRIAQSSPELATIATAILSHHENWDGSGYPQGLMGSQIRVISRIVAIVDAYDAMTHKRPYREPLTKEEAMAEIRHCSGSQFDPELVETFITIEKAKPGPPG